MSRILLKLSGEVLAGGKHHGIDFDKLPAPERVGEIAGDGHDADAIRFEIGCCDENGVREFRSGMPCAANAHDEEGEAVVRDRVSGSG